MVGKINKYWIYINRNMQIIKDSQTKCVKGWTIEIKSCVWHNLLKAYFVLHTIIVVFWDSWTSASQDKMIFSTKTKHTRSCSANYSMPLSLSLTQKWMNKKYSHWERFLWKILFSWMRDNENLYVTEQAFCFSDNCCAQTNWLNN